jgi:hypothetical protein
MKNSNETTGNRIRDLPAWRALPEPNAPPRAPLPVQILYFILGTLCTCWFFRLVNQEGSRQHYTPCATELGIATGRLQIL